MHLLAQGTDINELQQYETSLNEGDKGEVRFYLEHPISEMEIQNIENDILSKGVILTAPIIQDAGILVVKFQKALAPLLLIAGAVALGIVVFAGILGWQLFSWMGKVPWYAWFIAGFAVLLVIVGGAEKIGKAVGSARI